MGMDRQYFKTNISPTDTYHGTVGHVFDIIAETIGTTFGPYGSHNLFKNGADVDASKDGLENLTMMNLDGSIPLAVYQMIIDVANSQANTVGDGTTSAILVMAYVYKKLKNCKALWTRYTSSEISNAMGHIQEEMIRYMTDHALPLTKDDILSLVHTSTDGNEDLTKLLCDLADMVLDIHDKNIILDYSNSDKSYFQTIQGIQVSGQLMNPEFGNQGIGVCALKNVEIIIVDGKVNINNDIINYVNKLKTQNKSLLILCSGVNDNFYRYVELMMQRQPEIFANLCVAYTSANTIRDKDSFYDMLKITNSIYIEENFEINAKSILEFPKGVANNVVIKNKNITLGGFEESNDFSKYLNGLGEKAHDLEEQLKSGAITSDERASINIEYRKVNSRFYKLRDGVTTLYVGGDTPQRKSINYRLAEDGLKALQSAMVNGYFYGCNTVAPNLLFHMLCDQKLKDSQREKNVDPSLYYLLEECLLHAYIDVYKKLILNRVRLSHSDIMAFILGSNNDLLYDTETGYLKIPDSIDLKNQVFAPIDLRQGNTKRIINPAKADINIVAKSIDAALVLATSNTIITDELEFEGATNEN